MVPKFETILVPTDFSPTSHHALEYAAALARQSGASVHLLHVVAYPMEGPAFPEAYWVELTTLREQLHEEAESQFEAMAATLVGVKATTEVVDGIPARTIVETAKNRKCQLIVMGTRGLGGFTHLLLGSVAERVVRTATCPVLTVSTATTVSETRVAAAAS